MGECIFKWKLMTKLMIMINDNHCMLEYDPSLPGKNKVNCLRERRAEKSFWN